MREPDVSINGTQMWYGPNCPQWVKDMWIEVATRCGDQAPAPEQRPLELRNKEHQVTLSNQDIIELAYSISELTAPLIEDHTKLFFEQANCYHSMYCLVQDLLKVVDPEYLEQHARVVGFYRGHLCSDWDRLRRVDDDPPPAQND